MTALDNRSSFMGFSARVRTAIRRVLSKPELLSLVGRRRRFVFCYHDVSEPSSPVHSPLYSTPPEVFRRHLKVLSRFFDWVSLDQVLEAGDQLRPQASITFDDGFLSIRDVALPILKEAGIPAAVFVCKLAAEKNFLPVTTRHLISENPDWKASFPELLTSSNAGYGFIQPALDEAMINRLEEIEAAGVLRERFYLSPTEIQDLRSKAVIVGSHSASHRVLSAAGSATLEAEISDNTAFLKRLGIETRHFALPFGKREHYSSGVLKALRSHGYSAVYTTNPRDFVPTGNDEVLVSRICVAGQSVEDLSFSILRTLFQAIDL